MRAFNILEQMDHYRAIIDEVHSWIVCAPIASPEEMMQNAERIALITSPEFANKGCKYD